MNQDEIHNLLLLLLLIGNNSAGTDEGQTSIGTVNDIILAAMLLKNCNGSTNDSCNRCPNTDTTF